MSMPRFLLLPVAIAAAGGAIGFTPAGAAEPQPGDLLAAADARIEKHRKADAVITVLDQAGNPVPGAEARVEQTRHAFLFGSNIFLWGQLPNEELERAYRQPGKWFASTRCSSPIRPSKPSPGGTSATTTPGKVPRPDS